MLSDKTRHLAAVIPAYNEATTIADIAYRTRQFIKHVIIVNDGSTDSTEYVLKDLPVTLLSNPDNLGKGKSLARGAAHALENGATTVITLDGDGQHQPEDIPRLVAESASSPGKIIIAARLHSRHKAPLLRRFANGFADFWISWAAGHRIRDSQSGFRLYPAEVFRQCTTHSDNFVYESEILIDAAHKGFFSKSTAIDTVYLSNARPSHYRPAADTWAIVRMVGGKLLHRGLYPVGLLRYLGILPDPLK